MSVAVVDMMEGPAAVMLTVATLALVGVSLDRNDTFIMKLYVAFITATYQNSTSEVRTFWFVLTVLKDCLRVKT